MGFSILRHSRPLFRAVCRRIPMRVMTGATYIIARVSGLSSFISPRHKTAENFRMIVHNAVYISFGIKPRKRSFERNCSMVIILRNCRMVLLCREYSKICFTFSKDHLPIYPKRCPRPLKNSERGCRFGRYLFHIDGQWPLQWLQKQPVCSGSDCKGTEPYTHRLCYLAHAYRIVTLFGKQLQGGFKNLFLLYFPVSICPPSSKLIMKDRLL